MTVNDGTFITARDFAMDGSGSATACDVNADGKLDLLVTKESSPGAVSVLLGDGKGGLSAAPITRSTGGSPSSLVMADFNGDGRPDAAAAILGTNTVAVLLNDGNWAVQPAPPRLTLNDVSKAEGKNRSSTSFTFTVSL